MGRQNESSSSMCGWLRDLVRNKIVMAIAAIVFGFILILERASAVSALVKILGWIVLIAATVYVIRYFTAEKELRRTSRLVTGIILAIVGIVFVAKPDAVVNFFPFMMGVVMIASGISDLVTAVGFNKAGIKSSPALIAVSVGVIVLGVLIILQPGAVANAVMLLLGITMLVNGVFDLVLAAIGKKAV